MTSLDLVDLVTRAQAGDTEAFSALVARFQDMATGYAYGVLRDLDAAEDAAQEAFIDAFDKLHQLQAAPAFGSWLRRIVFKRCDRRLRRRAPAPPAPAPPEGPESDVARAHARAWIRGAVEGLPEHERIVVALHYFGETAQAEVADFLELPLSTVKKRLFSARRRLEAESRDDMQTLRPSLRPDFSDRVRLFLSLRARDRAAALEVLDRHPGWIDQPEQWANEEALEGGFPLAHRATPLGVAASVGDLELVEALLARGADVDGRCGCDAQDTPLFAATTHGREAVVRRLLVAGADVHATNAAGHSPLDVARMRGQAGLAALLEAAGAMAGVDAPRPRPGEGSGARIETGIKALDLLAPLAPGMRVQVHAAAETGLMVLMAELSLRLSLQGWRVRWTTWAVKPWQRTELEDFAAQMGLQDRVDVSAEGFGEGRARGEARLAHFVFRVEGQEAAVEAALPDLAGAEGLAFVIAPWIPVTKGAAPPPLRAPYDAQLVTDPALAAEGIYPALDLRRTASRCAVDGRQVELQEQVRARADDPRLRSFTAQPFYVAQHDNGMPGAHVGLEDTIDDFAGLLRGEGPSEPEDLRYLGRLPGAGSPKSSPRK